MVEFIDITPEREGTPLNRANLMAMQGFCSSTTVLNDDGSITTLYPKGVRLDVTFNYDGSVTSVLTGEKVITKKTTFNGTISEVIY